jgi:uncharacterized protein
VTGVITDETIRRAGELLAEAAPPRTRIILFGSQARGEPDADSDLDFLVVEREAKNGWRSGARFPARCSMRH